MRKEATEQYVEQYPIYTKKRLYVSKYIHLIDYKKKDLTGLKTKNQPQNQT